MSISAMSISAMSIYATYENTAIAALSGPPATGS